jgi:hypothetical protein
MKIWMSVLVLALCFGFVGVAHAAKGDKKGLRGKVSSVDGKNVVVTSRGKTSGDVTVATDDNTSITVDGKKAAVGDLKAGMFVMVSPTEGTAASITATTTRPERKNKGTADTSKTTEETKKTDDAAKSTDSK